MEVKRYCGKVNESYRLGVKKAIAYGVFTGGEGGREGGREGVRTALGSRRQSPTACLLEVREGGREGGREEGGPNMVYDGNKGKQGIYQVRRAARKAGGMGGRERGFVSLTQPFTLLALPSPSLCAGIGALAYLAMLIVLWYGGRLVIDGKRREGGRAIRKMRRACLLPLQRSFTHAHPPSLPPSR